MVSPRLSRKTIVWPCSGSSASGAGGSVWPRATRPRARARRRPVTWMTCGRRGRWEEGRGGRGAGVRGLPGRPARTRGPRLCGELTRTLYPEALTCRPRLVRVDFMRTKKERSWPREEGGAPEGLASGRSGGELWGPEEETQRRPSRPLQSEPEAHPPDGSTRSLASTLTSLHAAAFLRLSSDPGTPARKPSFSPGPETWARTASYGHPLGSPSPPGSPPWPRLGGSPSGVFTTPAPPGPRPVSLTGR